jgi:hypothetical protein
VNSCLSIWKTLSSSHSKPEITTTLSYQVVYTNRYNAEGTQGTHSTCQCRRHVRLLPPTPRKRPCGKPPLACRQEVTDSRTEQPSHTGNSAARSRPGLI